MKQRIIILLLFVLFIGTGLFAQSTMSCPPPNTTSNVLNQCGGQYMDPGGTGNYPNSLTNCFQTICPGTAGQCVTLQMTSFSLESGFDFLYVYNGNSTAAPQLPGSPFTGNVSPGNLTANNASGCLTISLTTDAIINQSGWLANVICTPCGQPPPPPPGPVTAGDCSNAVNICTNASFQIDPNGFGSVNELNTGTVSNPSTNPASSNSGCLLAGELNSTWMVVNIATTGTLEFSFGAAGGSGCLDWIMWPYTGPATCNQIINNQLPPIRCNWNATCQNFTGIGTPVPAGGNAGDFEPELNVTCGQQYLICLSNYSSQSTSLPLNFFGTAQVSCSTFTPITVNSATICPGTNATLTANGGTTYSWNPGGQTTSSITVSPGSTTSYTVTGTGSCGTGTAVATVTVLPPNDPSCSSSCSVTANNNSPVCAGQNVNLTATAVTGATSYTWSGPSGFTASTQNATITAPAASGIYTITVVAGTATCTATTSITVNPLPTPTSGNNGPLCTTQTLNLTSTGGGTYSWSGPGGFSSTQQNPGITNVTGTNAGTYTVTVTSAAGCVATSTTAVVINPNLTVTAGNNGPLCEGANLNLTANVGASWSWTGPNGFTSTQQNPNLGASTVAMSGIYTVTATSASGCQGTGTTTVTINPLPSPTANGNSPLCANQSLNLQGTGGGTYSWTGPNGFTSSNQNPSIAGVTAVNGGTYTLTVTTAAGCTAQATYAVVVNPLPVVAVTGSTVCVNGTINLTATGGTTYSWSGPNAFTSNNQNPSISNATLPMAGNYTVTVTDANNCVNANVANVIVNPLPVPVAGSNSPICDGQSLSLTSSGGNTYSWAGPNGFTSNNQNPNIAPANTNASGTYTVVVTDNNNCQDQTTVLVTVNPLPTPAAQSNAPICQNQVLNLQGSGGNVYSWSGPGGFNTNNQNPSINNAQPGASGTYTLSVTDGNGCVNTTTVAVVVNPLPNPTAGSNSPVCLNQSINLTSSGGSTYSWAGPNGFTSTQQNPTIANATGIMAGNYIVTVTSAAGCVNTATVNVLVGPPLNVSAAVNDPSVCQGTSVTLTATGSGGSGNLTYTWAPAIGTGTMVATTPSISNVYTVTLSDNCGTPPATATVAVTVNPAPNVSISTSGNAGCAPYSVNLTGNSTPAAASCTWNFGNGSGSNSCTPSATYNAAGNYTVQYSVVDVNGCTNNTTTVINVHQVPIANFTFGPQPVTVLEPEVTFVNTSQGTNITNVTWHMGDQANTTITQNNSPIFSYPEVGTYPVWLVVSTSNGCIDSVLQYVKVDDDFTIFVPNSFTPNGDGKNDVFFAKGQGIEEFKMWIYDRWGNMIFFTEDITKGWDGKIQGKDDLVQIDTYVWKINLRNFKGLKKEYHGHVNVIK